MTDVSKQFEDLQREVRTPHSSATPITRMWSILTDLSSAVWTHSCRSRSMATPNSGIASLFEPYTLKGFVLPNRFVMPGMQRGWNDAGAPRPQVAGYYRRRVEGGVATAGPATQRPGVFQPRNELSL